MGNSWGHSIRLLTQDERDHLAAMVEKYGPRWYTCTGKCKNEALYATEFRYVTGRCGRVSTMERKACAEHGRRFAEKYGLPLPAEESSRTSRTGYMAVTEVLTGVSFQDTDPAKRLA